VAQSLTMARTTTTRSQGLAPLPYKDLQMAHFAKLDENNVVLDILVVDNSDINGLPFPESEAVGVAYLNNFLPPATYKQTSYNSNFRYRYAMIGGVFLPDAEEAGVFVDWKEDPNFIWKADTYEWIPPVPCPDDGVRYCWNILRQKWTPLATYNQNITVIGD
jgi:hypothetical protein